MCFYINIYFKCWSVRLRFVYYHLIYHHMMLAYKITQWLSSYAAVHFNITVSFWAWSIV
jgi:hypothetical protein